MNIEEYTRVSCGNWHIGWGYGNNNKIGKLSKKDGIYTWKGRSQGRHGQKYNHGAWVSFTVSEDSLKVIDSKGGYPDNKTLIDGVVALEQELKKAALKVQRRRIKKLPDATQTSFDLFTN